MRWLTGHEYTLPPEVLAALGAALGPAVAGVRVFERSRYARLHRARATTRPGRIYLAGRGADFCRDPDLMLHEYCHVLRQWGTGELTRGRYVAELLCRGYWRNRYEIEARLFAARESGRLQAALDRRE